MLILNCLQWWYGTGWKWRAAQSGRVMSGWADYFSVESILRTMFAPYKLTLTGGHGRGLSEKFQVLLDSLVSRFVGFLVRLSLLLAAALLFVVYGILSVAALIVWPFVPLLPLVAVILAVVGVGA